MQVGVARRASGRARSPTSPRRRRSPRRCRCRCVPARASSAASSGACIVRGGIRPAAERQGAQARAVAQCVRSAAAERLRKRHQVYVEAPVRGEEPEMPHEAAKRIRNVALVGHRGSGKTSLNEALLFQAGAINRLGSVADGTTVSDSAPDEKAREMSIAASLVVVRVGRPQDQPDRHARRAQLRRGRARRAERLRGRGVRGQRRDGRRGATRCGSGSAPTSSASRG